MSESEELTEREETYAQWRASGMSKTKAAKLAYPNSANSRQMGYQTELRERVKARILELKQERMENSALDLDEQIRRYNELYQMAFAQGKLSLAKDMLVRIDALGGFEAPSRSISFKASPSDILKDASGNVEQDIKRFQGILGKHSGNTHEVPKQTGELIELKQEEIIEIPVEETKEETRDETKEETRDETKEETRDDWGVVYFELEEDTSPQ